jgi:hypothetical protein
MFSPQIGRGFRRDRRGSEMFVPFLNLTDDVLVLTNRLSIFGQIFNLTDILQSGGTFVKFDE